MKRSVVFVLALGLVLALGVGKAHAGFHCGYGQAIVLAPVKTYNAGYQAVQVQAPAYQLPLTVIQPPPVVVPADPVVFLQQSAYFQPVLAIQSHAYHGYHNNFAQAFFVHGHAHGGGQVQSRGGGNRGRR